MPVAASYDCCISARSKGGSQVTQLKERDTKGVTLVALWNTLNILCCIAY